MGYQINKQTDKQKIGLVLKFAVFIHNCIMVSLTKMITVGMCGVISISAISKSNFLVKMFIII